MTKNILVKKTLERNFKSKYSREKLFTAVQIKRHVKMKKEGKNGEWANMNESNQMWCINTNCVSHKLQFYWCQSVTIVDIASSICVCLYKPWKNCTKMLIVPVNRERNLICNQLNVQPRFPKTFCTIIWIFVWNYVNQFFFSFFVLHFYFIRSNGVHQIEAVFCVSN